jgi:hypothetical protein
MITVNSKGHQREAPLPNLTYHLVIWLTIRTEENHENLTQNSWFLGRDLNPAPPKYKAGEQTALQQRSASTVKMEDTYFSKPLVTIYKVYWVLTYKALYPHFHECENLIVYMNWNWYDRVPLWFIMTYVLWNRQIHTTIWYYYVISVYHNLYIQSSTCFEFIELIIRNCVRTITKLHIASQYTLKVKCCTQL